MGGGTTWWKRREFARAASWSERELVWELSFHTDINGGILRLGQFETSHWGRSVGAESEATAERDATRARGKREKKVGHKGRMLN